MTDLPEPFGPVYPDLGAKVASSRKLARKDPSKRREHGENVLEAIRAKQRQELQRELASTAPACASGSTATTGEAILKAVKARQKREFAAAVARDRKARDDETIRDLYQQAMKEKQL